MEGTLKLEIIIRKNEQKKEAVNLVKNMLRDYMIYETDDKIAFNFGNNWEGTKDGTFQEIWKMFNRDMYISLAYYTIDDDVYVTDFEGNPVEHYEVVIDDRRMIKYLKRKMRIIKLFDKEKEIFEAKAYLLDLKNTTGVIVKVLDVFSVGVESGLRLCDFIKN